MSSRHRRAIADATDATNATDDNDTIKASSKVSHTVSETKRKKHEESEKSYQEWLAKIDSDIKEREDKKKQEKIYLQRVKDKINSKIKERPLIKGGKSRRTRKNRKNKTK